MANPFIDEFTEAQPHSVSARTVFVPSVEILRDHHLAGVPLVPAAVMLEMCAATMAQARDLFPVISVADFQVSTGVRFYDEQPVTLFTEALPDTDHSIHCRVTGEYVDRRSGQRDSSREYARATFVDQPAGISEAPPPIPQVFQPLRALDKASDYDPLCDGTVAHGPAWGALTGFAPVDSARSWFQLETSQLSPAARQRLSSEVTVSPVMDAILQACDVHCWRTRGTAQLPAGLRHLKLKPDLLRGPNPLWALVTETEFNDKQSLFDAVAWTTDGTPALSARGIQLLRRKTR